MAVRVCGWTSTLPTLHLGNQDRGTFEPDPFPRALAILVGAWLPSPHRTHDEYGADSTTAGWPVMRIGKGSGSRHPASHHPVKAKARVGSSSLVPCGSY